MKKQELREYEANAPEEGNIMAKVKAYILTTPGPAPTQSASGGNDTNMYTAILRPKYVPGVYSFGLHAFIAGIKPNTPIELEVALMSPKKDKTILGLRDTSMVNGIPDEQGIPDEYKGVTISMGLNNVDFAEEGVYTMIFKLNGEPVEGACEIPVYKGSAM